MKTRTQQFSGVSSFHCSSFYSWEIYLSYTVSMFVNILCIFPLHADWPKLTALSMALATGGTETEFNSWDVSASSPSFFALLPERPGKACLQLNMFFFNLVRVKWKQVMAIIQLVLILFDDFAESFCGVFVFLVRLRKLTEWWKRLPRDIAIKTLECLRHLVCQKILPHDIKCDNNNNSNSNNNNKNNNNNNNTVYSR